MSRLLAVALVASALLTPDASLAGQNQTPPRPQAPGQPAAGNQSPAGNTTPAKPPEPLPPAGAPLYISPGVVQHIQEKLLSMGYPVPTISGAWGENSSAGLQKFQEKNGLDAGGDLDELTLLALGMPQVLLGEVPPGADAPVTPAAASSDGAPVAISPRATRALQNKLTDMGFATDNVFGIWMAGSEQAARNFQKAKGLDLSSTLDLRILHTLGLTTMLTEAKPGKLPTDSAAQVLAERAIPFTGAPVFVGPAGIRQVQSALQQRGHKDVVVDGKWSEPMAASLKKFQEAQKLEPTGSLNLRTLRALGFNRPLSDLDQTPPAAPARPPS